LKLLRSFDFQRGQVHVGHLHRLCGLLYSHCDPVNDCDGKAADAVLALRNIGLFVDLMSLILFALAHF
jgi:hypothetical protein